MSRLQVYLRLNQTSPLGGSLWADTYIDDCCIAKTAVYTGRIKTATRLYLGELYLTSDGKLVYKDSGEDYHDIVPKGK